MTTKRGLPRKPPSTNSDPSNITVISSFSCQ
jgi:hypothetical protein